MEGIFHFVVLTLLVILPTAGFCLLYNKKQNPKKEPIQTPVGLISGYEEGVEEKLFEEQEKVPDNKIFEDLVTGPTSIGVEQNDSAPHKPLSTLLRELDDMMVNQNIGSHTVLMIHAPRDFEFSKPRRALDRNRFKGKDLTEMIPTYS